jgi:predicted nuclease of restriction endonuclease-like (RecB) superfamily
MAEKLPSRRHSDSEIPDGYERVLADIKARILAARTRAMLAANKELIELYWEIGAEILEREQRDGWGSKVIERLAADLRREFPEMTGLSRRNLLYMRAFAEAWPAAGHSGQPIVQQPVAQLPWGHNILLLTKLKDPSERSWYAAKAAEEGWSRAILQAQVSSDLRGRSGGAVTSFERALPAPDSELVRDTIKDPYNFEFLNLSPQAEEKELELALLNDVQSFLMEMGKGFALAGRQYRLTVPDTETDDDQDFLLDLLFYNFILRRFVVIDLKIEDFKPEFAGKMSFYLTAVDELLRQDGDRETIGLILCPGRNKTVTEWALRGVATPIAVARYVTGLALTEHAPQELQPALPDLPPLASELTDMMEAAEAIHDADAADEPTAES